MELSTLMYRMTNTRGQNGHERVWVSLSRGDGYFESYEIQSVSLDHPAGGIVLHITPTQYQNEKGPG